MNSSHITILVWIVGIALGLVLLVAIPVFLWEKTTWFPILVSVLGVSVGASFVFAIYGYVFYVLGYLVVNWLTDHPHDSVDAYAGSIIGGLGGASAVAGALYLVSIVGDSDRDESDIFAVAGLILGPIILALCCGVWQHVPWPWDAFHASNYGPPPSDYPSTLGN